MSDRLSTSTPLSVIADAALHPRPIWRSGRTYVLATIAGVVGLGNLWRFPYMAGRHGGGDFLVAYAVAVVAVAIPLAAIESAAGSLSRRSPVGTYRQVAARGGAWIGWSVIGLTVVILSYYFVVTGWTLGYVIDAARADIVPFDEFTSGMRSVWLLFGVGATVLLVLIRGLSSIERASLLLVPLLVLIILGLAVFAQGFEGASGGRAFLFRTSRAGLADTATWQAAAGQAFYSVGIGQGLLIAYGSYVPAGTNLIRSTATVALTNALVSIVSAVMVLSVVFAFGISPSVGAELSFTAFPKVFEDVAGGGLLAFVFFALLFLAGFTSCVGGAVVVLSAVRDETGLRTAHSAVLAIAAIVALGIPSALSFTDVDLMIGGEPVLDRVDRFTGSGVVIVLGLTGAALLARGVPRRALIAIFAKDGTAVGSRTAGPRALIRWVSVLPVVTAVAFVLGRMA